MDATLRTSWTLTVTALLIATAPQLQAGGHCSSSKRTQGASTRGARLDIVQTAVNAGNFKTLATALKSAGLVETLKGEGPFTVFAPTDEAFAKLPPGTVASLLQPRNKKELAGILKYHVVPGRVTAADVVKLDSARTVQGQSLNVDAREGVRINDAQVLQADIVTANGVIHVIDTVLMPAD